MAAGRCLSLSHVVCRLASLPLGWVKERSRARNDKIFVQDVGNVAFFRIPGFLLTSRTADRIPACSRQPAQDMIYARSIWRWIVIFFLGEDVDKVMILPGDGCSNHVQFCGFSFLLPHPVDNMLDLINRRDEVFRTIILRCSVGSSSLAMLENGKIERANSALGPAVASARLRFQPCRGHSQ